MRGQIGIESIESCKLKGNTFFSHLSAGSITDFESVSYSSIYPAGAGLFFEKQEPRGVFVLCSGEIKLAISSSGGKIFILKIAKPGEVLGLMATVMGNPYEAAAETLHPCQVAFVRRDDFLRFIATHPEANAEVVRQLSTSYLGACERLRTVALGSSAPGKIARMLLEWSADGMVTKDGRRIKLSLTHREIAELIGVTRETVTRTLSEFRHRQLVAFDGSTLLVSSRAGLESISGD
jgi:CRP/FNR family transcriptional regulator, cyclic AMP receptor protein